MTKEEIDAVFARVRTWPLKRQSQVATYLKAIEKFGDALWPLSDEDIADFVADLERDEVASEEEVAATFGHTLR
ncbi:MAG TPA: hypothetical protein VHZ78_06890 [Rhizomicrobium sp.]|jgi:hypothetical protein|nr:hypothetical protein [Rhizomicrobium sp.]